MFGQATVAGSDLSADNADRESPGLPATGCGSAFRATASARAPANVRNHHTHPDSETRRPHARVAADAARRRALSEHARRHVSRAGRPRAIYDWVVARTAVDSDTRVDPNVLVVHLARTSAIPARCVWGLGLASSNATKAQQCRAEVYLTGYGWVPVDATTARLFGSWEMNWIAFNYARD